MRFTISQVLNATALVLCLTLFGIAIAGIYLASDAGATVRHYFPAGEYSWWASYAEGSHNRVRATLQYDRSSEMKTFVAAAFSIFTAVLGIIGFWFKNKTVVGIRVLVLLLASAVTACVVSTICVAWSTVSAISEAKAIADSCPYFKGVTEGQMLTCSTENTVCNALASTTIDDGWWDERIRLCLELRNSRYIVGAFSGISFVLVVLYAALIWVGKPNEREFETAQRKATTLANDE